MAQAERPGRLSTNHLDPWEGGWWQLRDIVDYELAATRSILGFASTFKSKVKTNFYELNRRAISTAGSAFRTGTSCRSTSTIRTPPRKW